MTRINDLEAFVATVEDQSLTKASRRLNRSLQSISRSLATLEEDVGVTLIHRTTRRSVPSEAGLSFYRRIKPAVDDIREARLDITNQQSELSGTLRVGAAVLFAPDFLVPIVADYMRAHPNVQVELQLSDAFADLSDEQVDIAIRIGNLPDSSLQGRRLGSLRRVVFGAPSYLDRHGRPSHPLELRRHECLVRTVGEQPNAWVFRIDGKPRVIKVDGKFRANTMTAIYAAASHGLGLGYSPLWQIKHLIDESKVEVVLQAFEPPPVPIHALWLQGQARSVKVRSFIDFLTERLKLNAL